MDIIAIKLDVTKIQKERLFQGKNGAKYLDVTLIPVTNSKYDDDFMCVQSVTKEERARGVKGPILGNAKWFPKKEKPSDEPEVPDPDDPEVPF
jgi:hypothetical protein